MRFTKTPFIALLLGALLVTTTGYRLVHAQASKEQTANPAPTNQAPDPFNPSAKALVTALADEAVVVNYSVQDFEWTDGARQRQVPVRLYLPNLASASHPVPLVVFSHGLGGSRAGYSYLGRYFAQNGFASLHLQHVGSDRAIWSGHVLGLGQRLKEATTDAEALARTADFQYALGKVLADPLLGTLLNPNKVLAAGHSFGANTSLLIAGAKVERDGQALALKDPRVKGVILLSSPPFYGTANATQALAHMAIPSLHITATDDVIRVPGYYSSAEERVGVYDAYQGAAKSLVVFKDGSHSVFTDRLKTGGTEQNPQIKRATREVALAFAQRVLGESVPQEALTWAQRNAPILSRVENLPTSPLTAGRTTAPQ
jgi:predicted dienelactone hydrolase